MGLTISNNITGTGTGGVPQVGVTDGSAATAGNIGERISSTASASPTTSGNYGDLTSIVLTAGDWLVSYNLMISDGAPNSYTRITAIIQTVAGNTISGGLTNALGDNYMGQDGAVNASFSATISGYRMSVTTNTTVYAKYRSVYGGSVQGLNCRITAIRVR